MNLRTRLLDAILDGQLGKGLVVTRQEFIRYFSDVDSATTGVFLSNSEIEAEHSPHYPPCTQRLSDAEYRILPSTLLERWIERKEK